MPAVKVKGDSLHYEVEGAGPPLLLVHGFPFSSRMWRAQLSGLKDVCQLITPDLRGFGKSSASGPATMELYAADCFAILDALKLETAFVGGLSMGGYVAMAMLRVDAGRVRGLVLMDTQAGADDDAGKQKREENARRVEAEGISFLVDQMLPKLVSTGSAPAVREELRAIMLEQKPAGVASALRAMAQRPDSKDVLSRFSGPSLVIVGTEDEVTPVTKAMQLRDVLAGSGLVTIPGAGHYANLEAPEAVNATLREFFRTLPA